MLETMSYPLFMQWVAFYKLEEEDYEKKRKEAEKGGGSQSLV